MLPEPMLAKKATTLPMGSRWLMEPKYDGWRALASTEDGILLVTRPGNPITQVPYISAAVAASVPPNTIIDGEIVDLHSGAKQWNRTQSILGTTRGGYQHEPSEQDPPLTYVVFDVLKIAGEDLRSRPLIERKSRLVELMDCLDPALMHSPINTPCEEGLNALLAEGYEGVVVKDLDSVYVCGGDRGWYKIKPGQEIEARCTGTYPATPGSKFAPTRNGKPEPWAVGGICYRVEHPDGRVYDGRAAGMDDDIRRELHEHPERFVGRVVELIHWGVNESGALRHPNVKRFRSPADKPNPGRSHNGRKHTTEETAPKPAANSTRRMRNYGQMGDEKLLACIESLRKGSGEAYEKCLNSGSGDPAKDLLAAEDKARERGLL